jgi:ATP-dependent Clp protease ATP-binding subunit ClpA
VIQQRLENPLASRILNGEFGENVTIYVDVDLARHEFSFKAVAPNEQPVEEENAVGAGR